jgi:DNA-binding transcriptional MerR regulator
MKSPEAFRTISEVAEDLDLPQHVLRFWETRFPQIKPLKRGGGRRYYRPEDVLLLRGIRQLLYGEGYTIRGVQRILREQGVRYAVGLGGDALRTSRREAPPQGGPQAEERGRIEPRLADTTDDAELEAEEGGAAAFIDAAPAAADEDDGPGEATDEPEAGPAEVVQPAESPRPLRFAPVHPIQPANDPAPPATAAAAPPRPLSPDAERRLRAVLSDLIECKHLLEHQG